MSHIISKSSSSSSGTSSGSSPVVHLERYIKYGHTYVAKHMHYHTVHTIEPANIQAILATSFADFQLSTFRVDAMKHLFGNGIFTANGEKWQHARALIRPCFTKHHIDHHIQTLEVYVQNFLTCLPADGSTVDLQQLFFRFTMDTATEFLFGYSVGCLQSGSFKTALISGISDSQFVDAYTNSCIAAAANIRLSILQYLKFDPRAYMSRKIALKYIEQYVDEAVELRDSRKLGKPDGVKYDDGRTYIFLRELAKYTGDREVLRDQILNVLQAGRDTTASLLSNLFWELARHPKVYKKLRQEAKVLKGIPPIKQELLKMKYLRQCIDETLRLHPSVPVNTREAVRDTVLPVRGGADGSKPILVKRGIQVYYCVYALHRQTKYFGADPHQFQPERWENIRPGWEFLPFNTGPRICLGQNFSLIEASYLALRLIQNFECIEARDDRPWTEFYTLVVCSKYGTLVLLTSAT
ncbi:cytochrome P450 alkane hydroxylase-like protein [Tothia fuscella]|uniref:Cytochrome P450 alkane hydroxylase-like protein n=1 Tax=Tothia fuscella TaxID=1048955 RepID=A0A9P4U236_9PEZI|nr:cytochrome P450 alkane hydroxylase-like protein [Tothia fuscella]